MLSLRVEPNSQHGSCQQIFYRELVVLPAGGTTLTKPDQRQQIVGYALELASKIVCRVKHRSALAKMESEDIEQELLAYVLQHADRYNPAKGSIEAFTTRLMQSAVAKLIRESVRKRSHPPEGVELQSLSKSIEGPHRKSEELNKGLASTDKDRRRQTVSRDPLQEVDLTDAVERQIQTLPASCRRVARLLRTDNQKEIANKLGWSKRRVSQALAVIREHFSAVDWSEIGFTRDSVAPDCIASTGEDYFFQITQKPHTEKTA